MKLLRNICISLLAALLAIVASFWPLIYLSARYFDWKYPHDGQNGLGALVVGVFGSPFIGVFIGAIIFLWLRHREHQRSTAVSSSTQEKVTPDIG
jgi:hypothetical protein